MGLFASKWQNVFKLFEIFKSAYFTVAIKTKTTTQDSCLPATLRKIFTTVLPKTLLSTVYSPLKHIQISGIKLNINGPRINSRANNDNENSNSFRA